MSEKIQTNFYLLKTSIRVRNRTSRKIEEKIVDFEFLTKLMRGNGFKEQKVLPNLSNKYEIKVFFKRNPSSIKWKGYLKSIVEEGQDILKYDKSWVESYVIFIKNLEEKKHYASTGGYSHTIIQEIATNDFGIDILARIVKPEDKALKSSKEKNLTGGVLATVKFFRNDYNLYENENFGNIYNELNAAISKKQLEEIFGFKAEDLKNDILCIAKNSFSLKKTISFPELLKIISKCEELMKKERIAEINNVEKVTKSNTILLESLEEEVEKKLYANYKDDNEYFSIEVSHKEFEKYFSASQTVLSIIINKRKQGFSFEGIARDIQEIIKIIREFKNDLTSEEFQKALDRAYLETYDSDGVTLTRETLYHHFCTEVSLGGRNYFLMEKEWFEIRPSFIEKINVQCSEAINSCVYDGPKLEIWKDYDENEYNASYFGQEATFVFDKFTPQNIEVCDIMKVANNTVYYYHVKKGFNNSMRDLCNQVWIAARRVLEDSKSDLAFHDLLYEIVKNNKGETDYSKMAKAELTKTTKEEFLNLIKGKKIVFVLSVLDTSDNRILKHDLKKFQSNIAKFCLNELSKNMRSLGVDLQIVQLEKATP